MKRKELFLDYFFLMGKEERRHVYNWIISVKPKTEAQQEFLNIVANALVTVKYDYMIATIEPSRDREGNIFYKTGKEVLYRISPYEWWLLAKEFQPSYESEMANLYELFLWYAYRIAMGYWTIEYVCDNSSGEGNYYNGEASIHIIDKAGEKVVGGFADGVGNTKKLVRDSEGNIVLCGGDYLEDGDDVTVASVMHLKKPGKKEPFYSACVVLKKVY